MTDEGGAGAARAQLAAVTETLLRLGDQYGRQSIELDEARTELAAAVDCATRWEERADVEERSSRLLRAELVALQQRIETLCSDWSGLVVYRAAEDVSRIRAALAGPTPTEREVS